MYIGDNYSTNRHIQTLTKIYNFNCFDKKIKNIISGKSKRTYKINLDYLGYEYEKSGDLNDIPIYILYSRYGWGNECHYVLGLLDFLKIDYDKILKYARWYVNVFRNLGINLENTTPEQRISKFKKLLERQTRYNTLVSKQIKCNIKNDIKKPVCYIIKNKRNGLYKIGYSSNPLLREYTLQSQEPELESIKIFKNNHENLLHEKYKKQRVRGEWFDLTNLQVKYICTHFE